MRNKYPGICYVCKKPVSVGEGYFQREWGRWLVKHQGCKRVYASTDELSKESKQTP